MQLKEHFQTVLARRNLLLLLPVIVLVLCGFGIILSSTSDFTGKHNLASYTMLLNHGKNFLVACAFLLVGYFFPYRWWQVIARPVFIACLALLAVLFVPGVGVSVKGASRWLSVGGFPFQPSELMKFAICVFLAAKLSELIRDGKIKKSVDGFLMPLIPVGVVFLLIVCQPNFSMALLILLISFVMLFAAGVKVGPFFVVGGVSVLALIPVLLSEGYRAARVKAFLDPESYPDTGYQQLQSLIALANGGFTGVGIGHSSQKFGFLPEPFTDTIFAIVGEELGFLRGTLPVLLLFAVLCLAGLHIARHAPDNFSRLLAVGLTASFFFNCLIHVLVCVSWMPVTGQTLPFVSYGGTSLMANLFAVGVLLNIGKARTT